MKHLIVILALSLLIAACGDYEGVAADKRFLERNATVFENVCNENEDSPESGREFLKHCIDKADDEGSWNSQHKQEWLRECQTLFTHAFCPLYEVERTEVCVLKEVGTNNCKEWLEVNSKVFIVELKTRDEGYD